jgi:hypothetical protein
MKDFLIYISQCINYMTYILNSFDAIALNKS